MKILPETTINSLIDETDIELEDFDRELYSAEDALDREILLDESITFGHDVSLKLSGLSYNCEHPRLIASASNDDFATSWTRSKLHNNSEVDEVLEWMHKLIGFYTVDNDGTIWVQEIGARYFKPIRTPSELLSFVADKAFCQGIYDDHISESNSYLNTKISKYLFNFCVLNPSAKQNHAKFGNTDFCFPLRDIIIEVKQGKITTYNYDDAEKLFTYQINCEWSTNESEYIRSKEIWGAFFKKSLIGKVDDTEEIKQIKKRFFQIVGHLLIGDPKGKAFVVAYGAGDDGKSTFANSLERLFMPRKVACTTTLAQAASTHGAAYIKHSRLLLLNESNGKISQTAIDFIKRLSGGDGVPMNQKHADITQGHIKAKLFLTCNHIPRFAPGAIDHALLKRIQGVQFYSVPKKDQDPFIEDALVANPSYLIRKAIKAFANLQNGNYEFANCKKDSLLLKKIFEADPAVEFLEEFCEFGATYELPIKELKEKFKLWKETHGIRYSVGELKTALLNLGYEYKKINHGKGNNRYAFVGIRLIR